MSQAFDHAASASFLLEFYRRVFAGQAVTEVRIPRCVVDCAAVMYCCMQAFAEAQAAAGAHYVLISTADAPETLTSLSDGAAAAGGARAAPFLCPTDVTDGDDDADADVVDADTARACADLCSRSVRRVPRFVPLSDKVGETGRRVAAFLCQQALNRSQGSDLYGDISSGYPGGVFYADVSSVAQDALHAHLAPLLANVVESARDRCKYTLLVMSGCEHHTDEQLRTLCASMLTTARGLTVCAVGTSVCL